MKILALITDGYGGSGGIARYNRDLLAALCSYSKCEKVIAIPRVMPNPPESLPGKLTYVTDAINNKIKYVFIVLKYLLIYRFDLIVCGHIHLLPLAAVFRLIAPNAKLVVTLYGLDAWQNHRQIMPWMIRKVDTFVSISEFTKKKFLSWAKGVKASWCILPPGVDFQRFTPGSKNQELVTRYGLKEKKVIMTLARLDSRERYKGIDEVLDVMPGLIKKIPNLIYLIAGDGTDKERIQNKVICMGLKNHVIFTGQISEAEKVDHYRLADVFVMAGKGEGFGIVFLEAAGCGVPTIVSCLDGSRETVRDAQSSFIVNPNNPDEIICAILTSIEQPKNVSTPLYFSEDNFKARLFSILTSLERQN
jgi:phosphatidyl-myo-inositol dimannoside synthase